MNHLPLAGPLEKHPWNSIPPAFSSPVSLKLKDQHPQACTRWLRQQQQPNVPGMSCQSVCCVCVERWQLAGGALAGPSALEHPCKALVDNHPPCPGASPVCHHTPHTQRHLGSLGCARNALPTLLPPFLAGGSSSQPWLVPGTSPSTTSHPSSISFSKCLWAVVLAFLS